MNPRTAKAVVRARTRFQDARQPLPVWLVNRSDSRLAAVPAGCRHQKPLVDIA